jgi:hypothetical protein
VLLVLICAILVICVRVRPRAPAPFRPAASTAALATAPALARATAAPSASPAAGSRAAAPLTAAAFNARLRCAQYHFVLARAASPEVWSLLCAGKQLDALGRVLPLARAGDQHALRVLISLSQCSGPEESATHRERMLQIATRNGAAPETLQRLDVLLTQEQVGPSVDEVAACQQAKFELTQQLLPRLKEEAVNIFGRALETLRGADELDLEIEYRRKTLAPGDADAKAELAHALLQKDTPESQAEAMTLLRDAADGSPDAAEELARCLLKGCPTPAADPTEAQGLLVAAASAGNLAALMALAGPADPEGYDLDPNLPPTERYAWGQFLQRLNQEGCFGAAYYASWALGRALPSALLALSPADAAAAQARAAALLGAPLSQLRAQLGCG